MPGINAFLDVKPLNRHIAIIGTSGGGKTYLSKVIIEEILLQGYSSILIDPQGDLCSLLIPDDETGAAIRANINFKILTPGSKKGIPLGLNIFETMPPELLEDEEFLIMSLDHLSLNILNLLGIEMKKGVPPQKPLIESLIRTAWLAGEKIDFQALAEKIATVEQIPNLTTGEIIPINQLISPRERVLLAQKLTSLSAGTEGILFSCGETLDVSDMLESGPSCYIINLQSLGTDPNKRQLVLSWIMQQIYSWMLTHPQADQDALRLFLYIDEVADFLPIHPNNPPSKKLLMLLLRQARKYGVGIIIATQSPGSIEYKALDNVNTLFVGKIPTKQSSAKIEALISPYLNSNLVELERVMTRVRKLNPGEFFLVHPGETSNIFVKIRKLHTKHETIALDRIRDLLNLDSS
ncbi:MAG TPA: DUF87 domain-containing protein [Candidatus Lokiarchaeia archaeon]|nr:DUF87 domain-containing protein [Candidatus Lokiarchaeia archaeon]